MPTETRTTKGGVITWDIQDWTAGLSPQGTFSSSFTPKQTDQFGWRTVVNIDPFRFYGILSPGYFPNVYLKSTGGTAAAFLGGAIMATQLWNNTLMFGLSSGGLVHRFSYAGGSPTVTDGSVSAITWPNTIAGTSPVGQDFLTYRHSLGASTTKVNSIFYSYYNNANWDVGIVENVNSSGVPTGFNDDFMSSVPTTPLDITTGDGDDPNQRTSPHPMCIGSDGVLYIGSGNYLHGYDGDSGTTNGTFYSKILTFSAGFQIIAIRKYNDTLLIAGNYYSNVASGADGTGEALVYVWNYSDLNTTQVIPLEDSYVSALFIYKGNPTVITSGIQERNGTNKVKAITGISTTKLCDFDGTIPNQRGVLVADTVLYMNAGGRIITYGDKFNNSDAVNYISTCNSNGVSGFLSYNFSNSSLMASSSTGASTSSIQNFDNAGFDSATIIGDSYQINLPYGKRARVKSVLIQYQGTVIANGSNGNFTLTLNTDFASVSTTVIANVSSIATPLIKKYLYTSANGTLPNFTTIALSMAFAQATNSAIPLPSSIELEYEDLDIQANTIT